MTTYSSVSSVSWQDFFREEPCEYGFARFAEAVEKHGLHAAVKGAPDSDRRWGAEATYRVDILAILAQDTDGDVRRCVAKNPHTPVEALSALAHDANDDVRSIAQDRLQSTDARASLA